MAGSMGVGTVSGQPVNPTPIMKRKITVGLKGALNKRGLNNGTSQNSQSTGSQK